MDEKNNDFDFDFTPIGQAIKKARTARGMTREQLARIIDYELRHLQAIENEGQYPSLELFIQLVTMFDISVDEYIFPDKEVKKSSIRRRLDAQFNRLDDRELSVIEATVNGLCKAFETEHVDLQHLYIDGSKFEANANKYSWVWKKATEKSRYRLFDKITKLLQEINEEIAYTGTRLCINTEYAPEYLKEAAGKYAQMWQIDETTFVHGRGYHKSVQQRHYEKLIEYAVPEWKSLSLAVSPKCKRECIRQAGRSVSVRRL